MNLVNKFSFFYQQLPLVAILRGIPLDSVGTVGDALLNAGFKVIEIPLNTENALECIASMRKIADGRAMVGAGTVLSPLQVRDVLGCGGEFVVAPNASTDVIHYATESEIVVVPGVATPSEALRSIEAGAHFLKVFPASQVGCDGIKAWQAILPEGIKLVAVGGVGLENLSDWRNAGCSGVGLGASLYKPGMSLTEIENNAKKYVEYWARGNQVS
jgi:2-dehydro-3-deoxyphosphogalactonate aldolase